jgi:hypothetical protein
MPSNRHHPSQSRPVGEPQPGFYKVRLVAKGWAVPAQLGPYAHDMAVTLDGKYLGRWSPDELRGLPDTHPAQRIHLYGERIDESEYRYLNALREFARAHKPGHPCLSPDKPIDIRLLAIDEF